MRTHVQRYSKPRTETDEQLEAKFVRSLPAEEREAIAKCFNEMDVDFSGSLNYEELSALLQKTYGMSPSDAELTTIIQAVDKSGDGVVSLDEFITAMATIPELRLAGDIFKWRAAFEKFDSDGSGFVDGDELLEMVKDLSGDAASSNEDIQSIMEQLDESNDGEVSWPEFLQVMKTMNS